MAPPDDLSIVPPPPSYPTDTYRDYNPFDDFYLQKVDEILRQDANQEGLGDSDWPCYSGADGSGDSPASYSLQKGDTPKANGPLSTPRVMTKSKTKKTTKPTKSKKKRPAAKREITVIDLRDSDEEDPMPKDTGIDQDKHDEHDDLEKVNGDDNLQTGNASQDDSDDPSKFVEAMEGGAGSVNPKIDNNKEILEPTAIDVRALEANVAPGDEIVVPQNMATDGIMNPMEDSETEDFIFSSVTESVKVHVLKFIGRHPFMSEFVQPVKRSARRQFITEICNEAGSRGLDTSVLWDLIKYVRRAYLARAGVKAEPLAPDLNDIPFGQEIEGDSESNHHSQKNHKRSRREGSPGLKNKRSKRRLLDVQESPKPAATPEVIEIPDDDTSPSSPELPDAPGYAEDENTTIVQVLSTPDSQLDPVVADGDESQDEVAGPLLVQSTLEPSLHPLDVQAHGAYEGNTTVQVESTPELPVELSDAASTHNTETIPTEENVVESTLPIENTLIAHDKEEDSENVQETSKLGWAGEHANGEVAIESLDEPKILKQAATDDPPGNLNLRIIPEQNKDPPAKLSKSKKRKQRRQMLMKAVKEGKTAVSVDGVQLSLPLHTTTPSGDDLEGPTAHNSAKAAKAKSNVNGDCIPRNLEESEGSPKGATDAIQENLFPDYPHETPSKVSTKLSKNQKRQERIRARREKRERRNQEQKMQIELKAQRRPVNSWLKDHNKLSPQDTPVQTSETEKLKVLQPSVKTRTIDPEPRKERKRKERGHKQEQKRERKRKRESLKLELNSAFINDGQNQEDLFANEDLKLDEQELKRQPKKERKQEQKRQSRSLASLHDNDRMEDEPISSIQLPIESQKLANDRGDDGISSDHDKPKSRVRAARETPQPDNPVVEKAILLSPPQPEAPLVKVREPMSTPQRDIPTPDRMPMSTPASQCTSASRSRYGPLSPDPKEWDSDF